MSEQKDQMDDTEMLKWWLQYPPEAVIQTIVKEFGQYIEFVRIKIELIDQDDAVRSMPLARLGGMVKVESFTQLILQDLSEMERVKATIREYARQYKPPEAPKAT